LLGGKESYFSYTIRKGEGRGCLNYGQNNVKEACKVLDTELPYRGRSSVSLKNGNEFTIFKV
jgi:hypothetical protein